MMRARYSLTRKRIFTPILKLDDQKNVPSSSSHSFSASSRRSFHPVVPHTTGTPARRQVSTLPNAVAGVVNSMATSACAKRSVASFASSPASTVKSTVWPRSISTRSISCPIVPYPMMTVFMPSYRVPEKTGIVQRYSKRPDAQHIQTVFFLPSGNITVLSAIRLRKERRAYRYAKRVFSPIRRKYP